MGQLAVPKLSPLRRNPNTSSFPESPCGARAAWTATRCNRLLRPIVSKVAALRHDAITKDTSKKNSGKSSGAKKLEDNTHDVLRAGDNDAFQLECSDDEGPDPRWVPEAGRKRPIKKSYVRRGRGRPRKDATNHMTPDNSRKGNGIREFTIPTPVIAQSLQHHQVCGDTESSAQEQEEDGKAPSIRVRKGSKWAQSVEMDEILRRLGRSTGQSTHLAFLSICDSFHTLLSTTASSLSESQRKGAPSLFSMCLRRVPDFIKADELWLKDHGETDNNTRCDSISTRVTTEIYSGLEAHYSPSENGWRPLKQIVRAHGTYILGEAIKDCMFSVDMAKALIWLCLDTKDLRASREAETLFACLMRATNPTKARKTSKACLHLKPHMRLDALHTFTAQLGRYGFLYRQVGAVLEAVKDPKTWLSVPGMEAVWSFAVTSIVRNDSAGTYAIDLIDIVIRLICSLPRGKDDYQDCLPQQPPKNEGKVFAEPEQTWRNPVMSLVSALTAVESFYQYFSEPVAVETRAPTRLIPQLFSGLYDNVNYLRSSHLQVFYSTELASVLFADILLTIRRNPTKIILQEKISLLASVMNYPRRIAPGGQKQDQNDPDDDLASFLCSIARCCGKGTGDVGFHHMKRFVQQLLDNDYDSNFCLTNIAIKASNEFAEGTGNRKHAVWVEEVEMRASNQGFNASKVEAQSLRTPRKSRQNGESHETEYDEHAMTIIKSTPGFATRYLHYDSSDDGSNYSGDEQGARLADRGDHRLRGKQANMPLDLHQTPRLSSMLLGDSPEPWSCSPLLQRKSEPLRKSQEHFPLKKDSDSAQSHAYKPLLIPVRNLHELKEKHYPPQRPSLDKVPFQSGTSQHSKRTRVTEPPLFGEDLSPSAPSSPNETYLPSQNPNPSKRPRLDSSHLQDPESPAPQDLSRAALRQRYCRRSADQPKKPPLPAQPKRLSHPSDLSGRTLFTKANAPPPKRLSASSNLSHHLTPSSSGIEDELTLSPNPAPHNPLKRSKQLIRRPLVDVVNPVASVPAVTKEKGKVVDAEEDRGEQVPRLSKPDDGLRGMFRERPVTKKRKAGKGLVCVAGSRSLVEDGSGDELGL